MSYYAIIDSPLDSLCLTSDGEHITGLHMEPTLSQKILSRCKRSPNLFKEAIEQINAYFYDGLTSFTLPLKPPGTPFQRRVWQQLEAIPFGSTTNYRVIAEYLDRPKGARAIGAANGRNPICILIPCHRVVASSGDLCGYRGGLLRKQWLLNHETGQMDLFN